MPTIVNIVAWIPKFSKKYGKPKVPKMGPNRLIAVTVPTPAARTSVGNNSLGYSQSSTLGGPEARA
jgi:hypothetical protein